MKDWIAIAKANGLEIPAGEVERIVGPLDALEETFRPLARSLQPEAEPATGFSVEEDQ